MVRTSHAACGGAKEVYNIKAHLHGRPNIHRGAHLSRSSTSSPILSAIHPFPHAGTGNLQSLDCLSLPRRSGWLPAFCQPLRMSPILALSLEIIDGEIGGCSALLRYEAERDDMYIRRLFMLEVP
jgi:hypothetical protein